MNLPIVAPATEISAALTSTAERATAYAEAATADNTRRAYKAAWADFTSWCAERHLCPLPAEESTVGLYLADRASVLKRSTLGLRLAAISVAHRAKAYRLDTKAPQIASVLCGIGRVHGSAPVKKEAATLDVVRDAVRALAKGDSVKALRDRAIMLIGFAAALRRSELAAIDVEHLRFVPDGLVLTLPRRKTDQEGEGSEIGIPFAQDIQYCPVLTAQALIERCELAAGPLFRSVTRGGAVKQLRMTDRDIARSIQGAIAAAGYAGASFGGHSLRAGFATTAGRAGVPERIIMLQTGHKSLPVLRGYIRRGSLFSENAAKMIGL